MTAAAQPPQRAARPEPSRRVALTFDDIPGVAYARAEVCDGRAVAAWNAKLLATLRAHRAPALGLVNASRTCDGAVPLPSILDAWLDAGHDLGNHTFSHPNLNTMSLADYEKDIVRGEPALRAALARHGRKLVYFRHPQLHAGDTAAKKAGLARFLRERGYVVAPVTLDNQEWVFANAYARALNPSTSLRAGRALAKRVAEAYVPFMESTVAFFEKRTREVIGRDIPQIILLHMNALNADTLDELLRMFERRGYRFISVDEALRDPAYALRDGYTGAQGISWIHRWGIAKGMAMEMEPREPEWIADFAR